LISGIISWLASLIISVISGTGYFGVFVLMALESACIPISSEVIMPFSGFLVWQGQFALAPVVLWGAFGNLSGSIIAYVVGYYGGRPLVERYGKYILVSKNDLALADKWFSKYGQGTVFFSRLLPVIRTFISLPAGIARMPFWKFCFYTFIGSLPWSALLAYFGILFGENWQSIEIYFRKFDWLLGILIIFAIGWFIYKKIKNKK